MTMCCCGNDKLKRHLYTQTYSHNRTICNLLYSKKREANAERTTVLIRFVPVRCLDGAVWAGGASFFDFISFRGEKHCSFALKTISSVVSLQRFDPSGSIKAKTRAADELLFRCESHFTLIFLRFSSSNRNTPGNSVYTDHGVHFSWISQGSQWVQIRLTQLK